MKKDKDFLKTIENSRILITGGTGSVGSLLAERLSELNPKVVRIFSRSENLQYNLAEKLNHPRNFRFLIGDIRDYERLLSATEEIDLIIHCAAMKHVSSCEYNPFEAVKTNILGTQNIIRCAMEHRIKKVLFCSSDKAVNPANAMGASKLMAERLMLAANQSRGSRNCKFSCLRFGNILGSKGSAIHKFWKQIVLGEEITLTDENMVRYVLSPEDAQNCVFTSLSIMKGEEIFIKKMPKIRIADLIKVLKEIAIEKYPAAKKSKIKMIGYKSWEKLDEELWTLDDDKDLRKKDGFYIIDRQNHWKEKVKELDLELLEPPAIKNFLIEQGIIDLLIRENKVV